MTWQELEVPVAAARLHVVGLKVPVPDVVNETLPDGAELPEPAVSLTVTEQVVEDPALMVDGLQPSEVDVLRLLTVSVTGAALLAEWTVLPSYPAWMTWLPERVGV